MSLCPEKPAFRAYDGVKLTITCSSTEISMCLESLNVISLSGQTGLMHVLVCTFVPRMQQKQGFLHCDSVCKGGI